MAYRDGGGPSAPGVEVPVLEGLLQDRVAFPGRAVGNGTADKSAARLPMPAAGPETAGVSGGAGTGRR